MMKTIIDWITNNKEWIFSGLGISVLGLLIKIFTKITNNKNIQKIKNNSNGIQIGGNLNIKRGETDATKDK